MAAPTWKSYAIRPLGFPGVAKLIGWVVPASASPTDAVSEVRAYVAAAAVADPLTSTEAYCVVPLRPNAEVFRQDWLEGPVVVSWWALVNGAWVAGPRVNADLSSNWSADFAYLKLWAVETLQKLAREAPTLPLERVLSVRGAFPRDTFPLPSISVQFKAAPQANRVLGDTTRVVSGKLEEGISWNISIEVLLWTDTPEERDTLAPWFLNALQGLCALAPYNGLAEPNFNVAESEDFSAAFMERPIFLLQATVSGNLWSRLALPQHNYLGHLTV